MLLGSFTIYSDTPQPTATPTENSSHFDKLSDLEVAASAVLYNVESNTVMYSKEADKKVAPATTVKMMTAIIALDILEDRMEEEVTIPSVVMQNALGTHMELKTGEVIKIKELFHGLIMANANDAAYMLALVCAESIENFVTLMNSAAKDYGMVNTNYVNVTGTDNQLGGIAGNVVNSATVNITNCKNYGNITSTGK
jgi:D-alanyl-D-alanine carboxypeptidase